MINQTEYKETEESATKEDEEEERESNVDIEAENNEDLQDSVVHDFQWAMDDEKCTEKVRVIQKRNVSFEAFFDEFVKSTPGRWFYTYLFSSRVHNVRGTGKDAPSHLCYACYRNDWGKVKRRLAKRKNDKTNQRTNEIVNE